MSIKILIQCRIIQRKFIRLSRYSKLLSLLVISILLFILTFSLVQFRNGQFNEKIGSSSHVLLQSSSSQEEQKRGKAGILCYILLSPKKLVAAQTVKETWGGKCDKLIFYGRFNNTQLPVTFIRTKEGYRFLWGKTQAALIHLQQNYSHLYDWFLKADDDTFVVIENLRRFISHLNSTAPIWFGYKLKHPKAPKGYMSGGAAYVFSKAALENVTKLLSSKHVTPTKPKCKTDSVYGIEDLEIGNCFAAANVSDINTTDEKGRERFLPLPIETLWTGKVPKYHWIWRQAWTPIKLGSKCCNPQVISTHQITPLKMRWLFNAIYANKSTIKLTKSLL